MLYRFPKYIPPFSDLVSDIGNPSPDQVAGALGVSPSTVNEWLSGVAAAPRVAGLSLFWLTRWGQSETECELRNRAELHRMLALSAADECAALRLELARVVSMGDFGCANAPTLAATQLGVFSGTRIAAAPAMVAARA